MLFILLILIIVTALEGQSLGGPTHGKKVVCYWAGKISYVAVVTGQPKFVQSTLDPSLCTHLIYDGASYDLNKNIITTNNPYLDLRRNNGLGNFYGVTSLKERYPYLKVLIAVGNFRDGPFEFSRMASDPEIRRIFVRNTKKFLEQFRFDGLDINWYFPTFNGGIPEDRENFVQLAKELSESFRYRGYILSVTIASDQSTLDAAYDLDKLSRFVDLVHVRTFNYHSFKDSVFGANAPLRGVDDADNVSVTFTMDYILSKGVPPHKLILGLPLHGRTHILKDQHLNDIQFGVTATGKGFKGPYTHTEGFMFYIEICLALSNTSSTWSYHWDDQSATPYLRDQGRVISFDNARSLASKIKLAVEKRFGGFSVVTFDSDDYLGICSAESHNETETYKDYKERLNDINDDPALEEALKTLKFPNESEIDVNHLNPTYVLSKGKLKLLQPVDKPVKFKLTHIINDVAAVAVQEKRILDEIKRVAIEKSEYE